MRELCAEALFFLRLSSSRVKLESEHERQHFVLYLNTCNCSRAGDPSEGGGAAPAPCDRCLLAELSPAPWHI